MNIDPHGRGLIYFWRVAVVAAMILVVWIAVAYGAWVLHTPDVLQQKAVYAVLAVLGWAVYRRVLPSFFPAKSVGTPTGTAGAWKGALAGLGLWLPILAFGAAGSVETGRKSDWPLIVVLGAAVPVLEELLYRDGLQRFLTARIHPALSIVLSSAFFGLVHSFPAGLYTALCGLAFGVLYWRYGLISAILAHAVYNLGLLLAPWVFH